MADADVRWLQRLENDERALATLERALSLETSRPLGELEQLGLIQQEVSTTRKDDLTSDRPLAETCYDLEKLE